MPGSAAVGHEAAGQTRPTREYVIAFADLRHSGPVEDMRARWDPVMASQIAAHITLVYPDEVAGQDSLPRLAELAAARTPPFTVALGPAFFVGSPADGVFFRVHDVDGGIGAYRAAILKPDRMVDFPPHLTIVHPRTSDRGEQAWTELADVGVDVRFVVSEVVITAADGDRWQQRRVLPLTGPSQ